MLFSEVKSEFATAPNMGMSCTSRVIAERRTTDPMRDLSDLRRNRTLYMFNGISLVVGSENR
jgi:hypothetical protein